MLLLLLSAYVYGSYITHVVKNTRLSDSTLVFFIVALLLFTTFLIDYNYNFIGTVGALGNIDGVADKARISFPYPIVTLKIKK